MTRVELTESLIRTLLTEQHPDLAHLPLREVVGGWDNQMWRLGEDLAVRLPRTPRAPELLQRERNWLPTLAERLPLPIPTPVRLGEPSERFPSPWLITQWVPGEPADREFITADESGTALADFLRALHVPAPADVPQEARGGLMRQESIEHFAGSIEPSTAVRDIWADAVAAPAWDGPAVWVHSDLHPANLVVADGRLAGVIDFGDVGAGDPAVDISAAWVLLPDGAAKRFFAAYPMDEATFRRARGWAAFRALFVLAMAVNGERGLAGGKPTWRPAGEAAMERVLGRSTR
ncbi:aminoglycoside phosphotransferase family protein [Kribbella sandramycini]|uniref:Aminoglycoside phosphotransferase family protein n=1 Tax=Kribbella sandramycini TaxID=60450 RepID=A0A7Y4L5D1_9ACTN|nr:aminoglycoside phosphotransferase family protein [Kribbella sandramycini]NOL43486.1 aminoglycoside phosphotransferase family protein [Kribbella sandramycini]